MDPGSIIGLLSLLLSGGSALSQLFGGGASQGNQNAISSLFGGTPEQTRQIPRYTPAQENILNQLLSQGFGGLQNVQKPFNFGPFEEAAKKNFYGSTVPGIAERFTALTGGNTRSPAFAAQLGGAGAGLESNLAQLKSQLGYQEQGRQQNLFQNMLSQGLQPRAEQLLIPRSPGLLEAGLPSLLGGLGQGATAYGLSRLMGS